MVKLRPLFFAYPFYMYHLITINIEQQYLRVLASMSHCISCFTSTCCLCLSFLLCFVSCRLLGSPLIPNSCALCALSCCSSGILNLVYFSFSPSSCVTTSTGVLSPTIWALILVVLLLLTLITHASKPCQQDFLVFTWVGTTVTAGSSPKRVHYFLLGHPIWELFPCILPQMLPPTWTYLALYSALWTPNHLCQWSFLIHSTNSGCCLFVQTVLQGFLKASWISHSTFL